MPATIKATNVTAQLQFRGRGNPHQAHPETAVGNFFPGLEFNFQNVWKRLFIGLELLEYGGQVIAVDPVAITASGGDTVSQGPDGANISTLAPSILAEIDGTPTFVEMQGPLENPQQRRQAVLLEWSNLLARIHAEKGGANQPVSCVFFGSDNKFHGPFRLKVRRLIEPNTALIDRAATLPGEITESLCSPWQTDYIGCACYYWASNRPDYVNIQELGGATVGHNWLDTARGNAGSGPRYTLREANLLQHEHVMQDWESKFQYVIAGNDRPDGLVP